MWCHFKRKRGIYVIYIFSVDVDRCLEYSFSPIFFQILVSLTLLHMHTSPLEIPRINLIAFKDILQNLHAEIFKLGAMIHRLISITRKVQLNTSKQVRIDFNHDHAFFTIIYTSMYKLDGQ